MLASAAAIIAGSAVILWRIEILPAPSFGAASSLRDPFEESFLVEETAGPETSSHAEWWLNAGAKFITGGGTGRTLSGELAADDPWREIYSRSNPADTDGGSKPQNVFRLLTRRSWQNADERLYFRIRATNMSASPERNETNGIFLFSRYQGNNVFYALGLRVDGTAVIKRKTEEGYRTLAIRPVWNQTKIYGRIDEPNLLPQNRMIGMRSVVKDMPDGSVLLQLFMDSDQTGSWNLLLESRDTLSPEAIRGSGAGGIRTDFMDIEFENYEITEIR